jgi:hypothetical protein
VVKLFKSFRAEWRADLQASNPKRSAGERIFVSGFEIKREILEGSVDQNQRELLASVLRTH